MERQVGAPGLVDDQRLAPLVADVGDRLDVRAGAVRGRADDQRAGRVRMLLPRLLHLVRRGRVGQVQPFVVPGPDPLRLHPAENQPGHHRLVRVPADQQVAAAAGHGQHGRLDRQRAAAGGEERLLCADRVGHQLFGARTGIRARICGHRARPWQAGRSGTRPGRSGDRPRVRAAALAVPGRGEPVPVTRVVISQRLQQGCYRMIHHRHLPPTGPPIPVSPDWAVLSPATRGQGLIGA